MCEPTKLSGIVKRERERRSKNTEGYKTRETERVDIVPQKFVWLDH